MVFDQNDFDPAVLEKIDVFFSQSGIGDDAADFVLRELDDIAAPPEFGRVAQDDDVAGAVGHRFNRVGSDHVAAHETDVGDKAIGADEHLIDVELFGAKAD